MDIFLILERLRENIPEEVREKMEAVISLHLLVWSRAV